MAQIFLRLFLLAACLDFFSTSALPYHELKNFPGAADEVGKLPLVDFDLPFRHYSGYLDSIEDIKLHYWFFESQNKPETDPVVLWLNGGPGCSSLFGAFTENGPLRANHNGTFTLNPYSWNRNASLLYLESPVLVGFSFLNRTGVKPPVNTDDRTMVQNFAALQSFFNAKFPHLASNPFYITGESYAGRYIPQLSVEIIRTNLPSNFRGVAIGNGYLDPELIFQTQQFYADTHGLSATVNPYNILADCEDSLPGEGACSGVHFLSKWMNRADVQRAIHIYSPNGSLPLHWEYITNPDYIMGTGSMAKEVRELVDAPQGLKVIIYNGDLDTVCDFIADQKFVELLGYVEDSPPHLKQCWTFVAEDDGKRKILPVEGRNVSSSSSCGWKVSGPGAPGGVPLVGGLGRTFHSGRLVFLTVRGAGHMVPFDKPAAALTLLNEILLNN